MCAQELRLFSLGLLIKIALLAICGSLMLEEFFGPVVEHYLSSFPDSPYKHFNEASQSEKFPYPALMLYVLTLVNLFLGWSKDLLFSEIWIYRLPLLVSDVIIFSVLYSWLRDKERKWVPYHVTSDLGNALFLIGAAYDPKSATPLAFNQPGQHPFPACWWGR